MSSQTIHDDVREGRIDEVRLYIAQGGNINAVDNMKRTPLVIAAWKGNEDIVRLLLGAGADTNICAMDNFTPLHFAAQSGHSKCVKLIGKKNKSLLNARVSKGMKSALHLGAAKNHIDVVKVLIELGADLTGRTSNGQTASDLSSNAEVKMLISDAIEAKTSGKKSKKDRRSDLHEKDDGDDGIDDDNDFSEDERMNTTLDTKGITTQDTNDLKHERNDSDGDDEDVNRVDIKRPRYS